MDNIKFTFTKEEVKKYAIKSMENCMEYLKEDKFILACMCHGEANAWAEILGEAGIILYDEDEYYQTMVDSFSEYSMKASRNK